MACSHVLAYSRGVDTGTQTGRNESFSFSGDGLLIWSMHSDSAKTHSAPNSPTGLTWTKRYDQIENSVRMTIWTAPVTDPSYSFVTFNSPLLSSSGWYAVNFVVMSGVDSAQAPVVGSHNAYTNSAQMYLPGVSGGGNGDISYGFTCNYEAGNDKTGVTLGVSSNWTGNLGNKATTVTGGVCWSTVSTEFSETTNNFLFIGTDAPGTGLTNQVLVKAVSPLVRDGAESGKVDSVAQANISEVDGVQA